MLVLALILLETVFISGYPQYRDQIPNGHKVPDPCDKSQIWNGVGHKLKEGTGPRNPFGAAFEANGNVWNRKLCQMDSDGDGKTNGEELGDPKCTWTKTNSITLKSTGLSHPGVCEPVTSHQCMQKNSWLKCQGNNFSCPAFNESTTEKLNLIMPRTAIPQAETTYMCMGFKLPNETKYHLIGETPLVDNKNNMVHHMVLLGCNQPLEESEMTTPQPCLMSIPGCQTIIGLWTPGSPGTCYPEEFGFPIGKTGFQYAVLQLHWNNPMHKAGEFDSSGMTLYYTDKLRPNDGMVITSGQAYLNIPPQQSNYTVEGSCRKECTELLNSTTVNITTAGLHMHLLGKAGKIELIRPGNESVTLVEDVEFDYNTPHATNFDQPIEFRAGDEIKVTCEYQTLNKTNVTTYGESTQDEMCFGFLTIYPAVKNFDYCGQWQNLTQCSINNYDVYTEAGCDSENFTRQLVPTAISCQNCSDDCQVAINALEATGCWHGPVKQFIETFWPPFAAANFTEVFDTIDNCSANSSTAFGGNGKGNSTESPLQSFSGSSTMKFGGSGTQKLAGVIDQMNTSSVSGNPGVANTQIPMGVTSPMNTSSASGNPSVANTLMPMGLTSPTNTSSASENPSASNTEKPLKVTGQMNTSSGSENPSVADTRMPIGVTEQKSTSPGSENPGASTTSQSQGPGNTAIRITFFSQYRVSVFTAVLVFVLRR